MPKSREFRLQGVPSSEEMPAGAESLFPPGSGFPAHSAEIPQFPSGTLYGFQFSASLPRGPALHTTGSLIHPATGSPSPECRRSPASPSRSSDSHSTDPPEAENRIRSHVSPNAAAAEGDVSGNREVSGTEAPGSLPIFPNPTRTKQDPSVSLLLRQSAPPDGLSTAESDLFSSCTKRPPDAGFGPLREAFPAGSRIHPYPGLLRGQKFLLFRKHRVLHTLPAPRKSLPGKGSGAVSPSRVFLSSGLRRRPWISTALPAESSCFPQFPPGRSPPDDQTAASRFSPWRR